ncbi:MAG TPA: NAD(P)-dependent oxidoreductase [Rhizomicrobium sp.]|nr:NAD(P)-dependent oxidoreductase [Rhizomicrobium sp.]
MKILITGGAGDVGTELSKRLVSSGHLVVVYDLKKERLPAGVQFVEGDIRDFQRIAAAAEGCNSGIHLAALAGASATEEIVSVNVLGAFGFLLAARRACFRNSVVASSAPVHLAPSALDNDLLLRTSGGDDHVYDLTKVLQETIARDFHAHGLPTLCLRFGHIVLGEEESNLQRSLSLRDEEYCRGGWVALEDVTNACAAALETPPTTSKFEILNIVGARSARDRFLVAAAEKRLGVKLRYDFAAYE